MNKTDIATGIGLKWTATRHESELIQTISNRAVALAKKAGITLFPIDFSMDIEACHCNGMPLDLQRLLEFPDFDFSHDVFGIRRHLNRHTGKLEHCFVPRCAKQTATQAAA